MSLCAGFDVAQSSTASAGHQSAVLCERVTSGDQVGTSSPLVPVRTDEVVSCPDRDTLVKATSRWHGGLTSAARCLLLLASLLVTSVHADDSQSGDPKNPPKEQAKSAVLKSGGDSKADVEAAALTFAGEHHPELKTLVESLKSANPGEYKKAIHDLARTQERLAKLQGTKAGNRHDHELALWKLDSRIRLTAARSAMKETEELRAELKTLVEQRQALAIQQLKDDRERTAARLAKIDTELQSVESKQAQAVDAEVDRLLRSVKSKHADVTKNLKADKTKKPGDGKPKGKPQPEPTAP